MKTDYMNSADGAAECPEPERRDPIELAHAFARALGEYKAHRDV
jgi:hypothetical protein